ncbi:hypothetical protein HCU74_00470 [Spongiibacter sp. KMU-166]|uniref:START domain-containing protein n=1 Tax=Spongiibacter thalassae TaxID=2721624 RepID=A0ABX1GC96_9GAMM|nr:START domain-containing protein [Spongiibacter thalassae]NKI15879.1 hypothetical protein [Spongiibacter thalassae]
MKFMAVLVFFFGIAFGDASFADDWLLKKDDDGIKVFTKYIQGNEITSYLGITEINSPLMSVAHLMLDLAIMEDWFHLSYGIKGIENIDKSQRLIYMRQKTPVMIADRDMIVRQKVNAISDSLVVIELNAVVGILPEQKGYVRIPLFHAKWRLSRVDDQSTLVEYSGFAEPGGSIPVWLANKLVTEVPFQTLRKLRNQSFSSAVGSLSFRVIPRDASL